MADKRLRDRAGFSTILRKHWRITALLAVIMIGTVVVTLIADKGHDPIATSMVGSVVAPDPDEATSVTQVSLSPDGSVLYALMSTSEKLRGVAAFDAAGNTLWFHADDGPANVVTATSASGFAYATPVTSTANESRLTLLAPDGRVAFEKRYAVTVRGVALDGAHVAVALQASGNPVIVYAAGAERSRHEFDHFVASLDYANDVLAVGTSATGSAASTLTAFRGEDPVLQVFFNRPLRSVALSSDGTLVAASGGDLLGGFVAAYSTETGGDIPLLSFDGFGYGVPFVEIGGGAVLALEETPGQGVVHYWREARNAGSRAPDWSWTASGLVTRDPVSHSAGARISSDGRFVAVATSTSRLDLLDAWKRSTEWTYSMAGATSLAFARDDARTLATNGRAIAGQAMDEILRFDVKEEPFTKDVTRFLATTLSIEGVVALAILGGLYAREWRPRG